MATNDKIILNIPAAPGAVPVNTYDLVTLLNIQSAGNVYEVYASGAKQVRIDNRSNVPLLVQVVPTGGSAYPLQMGPYDIRILNTAFGFDSVKLSNLTDPQNIPLFGASLYAGAPVVTVGYVLLSFSSENISDVGGTIYTPAGVTLNIPSSGLPVTSAGSFGVGTQQDALSTGTAAANGTTTVNVPISNLVNGVLLLLANSAHVSALSITGHITGIPYFNQAGPYASQVACPMGSAYDTSIDVAITMPAGQTCQYWVTGRKDSLLSAVTSLDQPTITTTISGTPNVAVPAGVGVTGNVSTQPVGVASSSSASAFQMNTTGASSTFGAAITVPKRIVRVVVSVSAYLEGTMAAGQGISGTFQVGLRGNTSLKIVYLSAINESDVAEVRGTTQSVILQGQSQVIDVEMDMATVFPSDTQVTPYVTYGFNGAGGGTATIIGYVSMVTFYN